MVTNVRVVRRQRVRSHRTQDVRGMAGVRGILRVGGHRDTGSQGDTWVTL